MSYEVLITRRQSIFNFFANPGRGRSQHPRQPAPASTGLLRPPSAWICKKIKNALSSGYQDLMGHLILIRSDLNYTNRQPWQLKKSKSWAPFWSYQLDSSANPTHLPRKWAELAVLLSW